MELIVADANVFVYFFRCGLLNIFLSSQKYNITITNAVLNEITNQTRRISREHPEIRTIVLRSINDPTSPERLSVLSVNEINDLNAMAYFFGLEESGELDLGEIESIPMAIYINGRFLSNDEDAILTANQIQEGLGVPFIEFCREMSDNKVISNAQLQTIIKFMEDQFS